MINELSIKELASILDGDLHLAVEDVNQIISGLSIDTRTISPGDLFVAISGPRFDGHEYLQQALDAGASAAVTSRIVSDCSIPQIVVQDTGVALGLLGAFNRNRFSGTLTAITGSCGKTSVKEMLSAILSQQASVTATRGNLNNAFGVPLTLFQISNPDQFAVIELGTSSPGEIDYIARLARPDIALITNADEAHLADLIDVNGVAFEKGFILDALSSSGIAILNLDDPFYPQWHQRVKTESERTVVSFSLDNPQANCYAKNILTTPEGMTFILCHGEDSVEVSIAFWGRHQVLNACCAAAAAFSAGFDLETIAVGLSEARPFQRRGQRFRHESGALLIDETYNANPRATLSAIDQLADSACAYRNEADNTQPVETIMVLGDMLELGAVSDIRHTEVGEYAKKRGITQFAGYGQSAKLACQAFGRGYYFEDKMELSLWLEARLTAQVMVMLKGSRSMEMLDVIRFLTGSDYKGEG